MSISNLDKLFSKLKGSSSSGNFGHSGRPGKKGGSAPNLIGSSSKDLIKINHQANIDNINKSLESKGLKSVGNDIVSGWIGAPLSEGYHNILLHEAIKRSNNPDSLDYPSAVKKVDLSRQGYGNTDSVYRDPAYAKISYDAIKKKSFLTLQEKGYKPNDKIVLYRSFGQGNLDNLKHRPLSSWTIDKNYAKSRGGQLGKIEVQAKDIFAWYGGGLGSTQESEFVVHGDNIKNIEIQE